MYSVVLMMALTTSGELSDFGGRKGGCGGCQGCYGGCGGGLFSGLFHGRNRGHGCSGCYGGCQGGYGGCQGGYGGCQGGYGGCSGMPAHQPAMGGHAHHQHGTIVVGGGGCCGGIIIITPGKDAKDKDKKDKDKDKKDKDKDKKDKDKKGKEREKGDNDEDVALSDAPAKVIVSLPAEAKLKIEGQTTRSTGSERTFVTPTLVQGGKYSWTLEVELMQDDKPVTWTQKVDLVPGQTHRVSLTMPVHFTRK